MPFIDYMTQGAQLGAQMATNAMTLAENEIKREVETELKIANEIDSVDQQLQNARSMAQQAGRLTPEFERQLLSDAASRKASMFNMYGNGRTARTGAMQSMLRGIGEVATLPEVPELRSKTAPSMNGKGKPNILALPVTSGTPTPTATPAPTQAVVPTATIAPAVPDNYVQVRPTQAVAPATLPQQPIVLPTQSVPTQTQGMQTATATPAMTMNSYAMNLAKTISDPNQLDPAKAISAFKQLNQLALDNPSNVQFQQYAADALGSLQDFFYNRKMPAGQGYSESLSIPFVANNNELQEYQKRIGDYNAYVQQIADYDKQRQQATDEYNAQLQAYNDQVQAMAKDTKQIGNMVFFRDRNGNIVARTVLPTDPAITPTAVPKLEDVVGKSPQQKIENVRVSFKNSTSRPSSGGSSTKAPLEQNAPGVSVAKGGELKQGKGTLTSMENLADNASFAKWLDALQSNTFEGQSTDAGMFFENNTWKLSNGRTYSGRADEAMKIEIANALASGRLDKIRDEVLFDGGKTIDALADEQGNLNLTQSNIFSMNLPNKNANGENLTGKEFTARTQRIVSALKPIAKSLLDRTGYFRMNTKTGTPLADASKESYITQESFKDNQVLTLAARMYAQLMGMD